MRNEWRLALAGFACLALAGAAPPPNNLICSDYKNGNCQQIKCQGVTPGFCSGGQQYNTIMQAPKLVGSCHQQMGSYCNPYGQVAACDVDYFNYPPGGGECTGMPVCTSQLLSPGC